jgi:hypothetical protein
MKRRNSTNLKFCDLDIVIDALLLKNKKRF